MLQKEAMRWPLRSSGCACSPAIAPLPVPCGGDFDPCRRYCSLYGGSPKERYRFELTYEESGVLLQSNSGCEGQQLDPRIHYCHFSKLRKESPGAGVGLQASEFYPCPKPLLSNLGSNTSFKPKSALVSDRIKVGIGAL
jgi:hypothetical protein